MEGRWARDLQMDALGSLGRVQRPCPGSVVQAGFQTPASLKLLLVPGCIRGSLGAAGEGEGGRGREGVCPAVEQTGATLPA